MTDTTVTTTAVEQQKPVDNSGLGLPENLSSFLTTSDFRLNWETRNKFIFGTLICNGVLIMLITFAVLYNGVFQHQPIPDSILSLVRTMLWTYTGVFMTIIGAMFFGKQFDISSFRRNASDIIQAVATRAPVVTTAATITETKDKVS
jgi:hypothetical protein